MIKEHTLFPSFELVGPPCKDENCSGVLTDWCRWNHNYNSGIWYRKCSVCNKEFDHIDAAKKCDEAIEIIEKVFEKVNEKEDQNKKNT